ncbi:MAG: flagellar biosynthesis anti-sigma factor FlgM [Anaerovoracaceae bacterium]
MNISSGNDFRSIMSAGNVKTSGERNGPGRTESVESAGFAETLQGKITDRIEISSEKNMSDEELIRRLGKIISSEVREGHSAADISNVKQQLALGEYDINPAEIAKKILG